MSAWAALENLDDPTKRCKALSGPYTGLWRLTVGDYRVILDIQRDELVIMLSAIPPTIMTNGVHTQQRGALVDARSSVSITMAVSGPCNGAG